MQKRLILLLCLHWVNSYVLFSQGSDSTSGLRHFSGAASVTHNGISLIPTFTLGRPAAIFNMSAGTARTSFDPELAFSLEGRPWYFLFWLRHKAINTERFRMNVATHLGLNFRTMPTMQNNDTVDARIVERYLAAELAPSYLLKKNLAIGMYYLHARGLDPGTIGRSHFLTVNTQISQVRISQQFHLRLTPQLFYLRMDQDDGVYFNSAITLSRYNFPVTLSSLLNVPIRSNIPNGQVVVWNFSVAYSFAREYVPVKRY